MHDHRIFIAINFPKEVREQLFDLNAQWHDMPFRFTHPEDIHITLVFIGALDGEYLLKTLEALKHIGKECKPFEIKLTDIVFAPTPNNSKYIWLNIDAPVALEDLHKNVVKALRSGDIHFKLDYYPYRPHITLGRRVKGELKMEEENGILHEPLNLTVKADSFEVMESFLGRGGARYQIIQSYKLGS